jgi:D-tyrosyl-tRNA(Tyr) deacylase
MRVVVQRVVSASVEVDGKTVSAIGSGLLVLAGFEEGDDVEGLAWVSGKLSRLRIFDDEAGVMNRSIVDVGGDILAVSQFTLFASVRKGNRPSWHRAAASEISRPLFDLFVKQLETDIGRSVPTGVFGTEMLVRLENDGPVTLFIDSADRA